MNFPYGIILIPPHRIIHSEIFIHVKTVANAGPEGPSLGCEGQCRSGQIQIQIAFQIDPFACELFVNSMSIPPYENKPTNLDSIQLQNGNSLQWIYPASDNVLRPKFLSSIIAQSKPSSIAPIAKWIIKVANSLVADIWFAKAESNAHPTEWMNEIKLIIRMKLIN